MSLEHEVVREIDKTLSHLSRRNRRKYRWFVAALRTFKYLPSTFVHASDARGRFLEAYYTYMRKIDDIADGDTSLLYGYKNAVDFIEAKADFARKLRSPQDIFDSLLLYAFSIGKSFGHNFVGETDDLLSSMLFDARRRGRNIILPESDLRQHFYLLDIRGTVRAALKIYGEDPNKERLLAPLGAATRIHYNLRDYSEDIKAGFINISSEDCARCGITSLLIGNESSPQVMAWRLDQARKGLSLLEEHEKLAKGNFNLLARLTFPLIYVNPSKAYFEKLLKTS